MRVAAVILAAGESRRLGEPKQLVRLGAETLLERAVRVAGEAGCEPILVVLGARAAEIEAACALRGAHVLANAEWSEGMASSIRVGVGALTEDGTREGATSGGSVDAAIILGCDQPAVTAAHLRGLMGGGVVASSYAGRRGMPACFPADAFGEVADFMGR